MADMPLVGEINLVAKGRASLVLLYNTRPQAFSPKIDSLPPPPSRYFPTGCTRGWLVVLRRKYRKDRWKILEHIV